MTFITDDQKDILLALARQTLMSAIVRQVLPTVLPPLDSIYHEKHGCFVTLTQGPNKALRGCVGTLAPSDILWNTVMIYAVKAALHDSRFSPLQAQELSQTAIDISILTPMVPVSSYHDIILGQHGVWLEKNGRSSVFLPEVAGDHGWNLPTMLTYLSQKAGLPPDAWQEGARFKVFESICFGEEV